MTHSACYKALLSSAALACALTSVDAAWAQSDVAETGDIIVTAQRRSERLQDVPLSITALTGAQLQDAGVSSTNDLETVTPALVISNTSQAVQPTIRGVGTRGSGLGDESNVPIYLDGVYQPSMQNNSFELLNIVRVEVLKGPQGSLFGRNATGGAINIVTSDPDFERHMRMEVGYASFNEISTKAYVTTGLTDTLAIDLAAQYVYDNGYVFDLVKQRRTAGRRIWSGRGRVLWQPTPELKFIAAASHVDGKDPNANAFQPFRRNTSARVAQPTVLIADRPHQIAVNVDPVGDTKQSDFNLRTSYNFGPATLEMVNAYQKNRFLTITDSDATPRAVSFQAPDAFVKSWTNEVRLVSSGSGPLTWIVGVLAFKQDSGYNSLPLATGNITSVVETTAYAGYGEASYDITDRLTVLGGVRYSWERKVLNASASNVALFNQRKTWDDYTPRASVKYEFSSRANAYFTFSQGFKSGVFTATTTTPRPAVNPEKITAYEVGLKTSPASWLRANISAFYYDYKDLQAQARDANNLVALTNAASATIKGFDLDLNANPSRELSLRLGVAYTDGKFERFPTASVAIPIGNGGAASCDTPNGKGTLTGGNTSLICDVSGNGLIRAPKWTVVAGGSYKKDVSFGSVGLSANANYNSGYFTEFLNRVRQPSYTDLDASLFWADKDDRVRVTLFAENLLNEKIFGWFFTSTLGDFASYRRPRTFGVRLNADF